MGRPLRLLVQGSRESTRIALLDETRLLEFYQEDTGTESLVGSVFLGRVERVLPDVKAALLLNAMFLAASALYSLYA